MLLPDYWLTRPLAEPSEPARRAFDELLQDALRAGDCPTIEFTLPHQRWQFLCHVVEHHDLVAHGSADPGIDRFEPRRPSDLTEFGSQRAVYAASDGIWAMFFAIVDRDRVGSITNACVRLLDGADHEVGGPFYVFSVSDWALPQQPWHTGTVYLLPRRSFVAQPSVAFGDNRVRFEQVAGLEPVTPLAKLTVTPADFPFLDRIRGHDDDRLQELADALQSGQPWPFDC